MVDGEIRRQKSENKYKSMYPTIWTLGLLVNPVLGCSESIFRMLIKMFDMSRQIPSKS
jgi:hypothetical protein